MDISEFILDVYADLFKIEEEIKTRRFKEAADNSNSLLESITLNEDRARSHPNFHLLKTEFEKLRREALQVSKYAMARSYVTYGAQLIRTNPFGAVVHLGGEAATKDFPEIDSLRRRLQERAYEEYLADENHQKSEEDSPADCIGQTY